MRPDDDDTTTEPVVGEILHLPPDITAEQAIATAVGAASACWETLQGAGVFQSERALAIVGELDAWFEHQGQFSMKAVEVARTVGDGCAVEIGGWRLEAHLLTEASDVVVLPPLAGDPV